MSKETTKEAAATAAKAAVEAYGPPTRVILRVIFILLVVGALLWMLFKLTGILLLLVLSIFFAYLVSPLVEFLRRERTVGGRTIAMPKVAAITLAYLLLFTVVVVAIYAVLPSLSNQYPEFATTARDYWKSLGERTQPLIDYSRSGRLPPKLVEAANNAIPKVVDKIGATTTEFFSAALGYVIYLPWLVLIPILAFFLLKDADSFRRSALLMLPRGRWRWRGDEFFQDINSTLAAYIRAQLTACLLIGIVCAIGFTLLGLPGGLVMGVVAGVLEFIPLVGPLTVAIMAAVLAMLHAGPFNAFVVLLFLGVLRIVHDYAIYPRLIGQGIHLHPLAVIFAILAGEKLAGVAGIFLAIPVVAILTVSYRHWLEHRGSEGFADLLEPAPAPALPAVPPPTVDAIEEARDKHLHADTTPEQMKRRRPDLTTGELKMPLEESREL
ncbi:MAG: AI-2E family transporter [Acidobacteria bacterium]|nr:AI-2E family transporter [Acidobacteriota bacterium]MCA1627204.1 AI-2E family transporter [Acidobacteriota bacterium]